MAVVTPLLRHCSFHSPSNGPAQSLAPCDETSWKHSSQGGGINGAPCRPAPPSNLHHSYSCPGNLQRDHHLSCSHPVHGQGCSQDSCSGGCSAIEGNGGAPSSRAMDIQPKIWREVSRGRSGTLFEGMSCYASRCILLLLKVLHHALLVPVYLFQVKQRIAFIMSPCLVVQDIERPLCFAKYGASVPLFSLINRDLAQSSTSPPLRGRVVCSAIIADEYR